MTDDRRQIPANPHRIMFLTPHNPWGRGGGSRATLAYLNAIREIFPRTHIDIGIYDRYLPASADEQKALAACYAPCSILTVAKRPLLERLRSVFTGEIHRFNSLAAELLCRHSYDLCVYDKSHVAGTLISLTRRLQPGAVIACIHHNFEPDYFRQEKVSRLFKALFLPHIGRLEKRAYRQCDINLFLTEDDRLTFLSRYGKTEASCGVTGFFEPVEKPLPPVAQPPVQPLIAITGSLNNPQNLDGLRHFFADLANHIPAGIPLIVAGQKPDDEVRTLCASRPGTELIADPDDMEAIIARATLLVCPTRTGGGIKIRVTDGLRQGVPVLTSRVSARGYGRFIQAGAVAVYTDGADFGRQLKMILEGHRLVSPEKIQQLYNGEFSHSAGTARLRQALIS